ncbi:hematopoietic prostaglandin D synthase [Rhincodon typus]|uniref:hematopoietic prostaglandin D synthase n=1 Tax=Rhincodon typus TaxID=259920 RepID=UPI0009A37D89|nr:hematopoietic prostaglandin D synthase [Rhincodon typus]XP_048456438.1 hematopoietic prostaglandin D synthase [Rhincodon typus]
MPNYKLTYFKIRGRAETARYIFAYSGINYEDNTIDIMDWPNIKQSLLFQQIPILKVDKTEINQSSAIARYLARETGIAGKSNLEQAQADAIVDTINDFMNMFPWTEKDPIVKQKITDDVFANNIPLLLDGLSKLLGDRMWFVGDSVTWADFHWAVCSITLTNLNIDILHNYPKLLALKERVEALPKIAAWIEQRPKTAL